jgi:hypothetical protein
LENGVDVALEETECASEERRKLIDMTWRMITMIKRWMKKRKTLCCLAVACLFTFTVASAVSNAATITFDEYAATNNNAAITNLYSSSGVAFGGDNSGTWGGNSNGNLGGWNLEGTNGPAFLGNNGQNNASTYVTTILFNTAVSSVSFDVSRSNGSEDGQTMTVLAYTGATLLGSTGPFTLGAINSWTAVSLNFAGIDKVVLDGSTVGFSPYGIDNLQFGSAAAVPEPVTLWLLGAGLIGLAGLSRRYPV